MFKINFIDFYINFTDFTPIFPIFRQFFLFFANFTILHQFHRLNANFTDRRFADFRHLRLPQLLDAQDPRGDLEDADQRPSKARVPRIRLCR
jgi:hypothetical protein